MRRFEQRGTQEQGWASQRCSWSSQCCASGQAGVHFEAPTAPAALSASSAASAAQALTMAKANASAAFEPKLDLSMVLPESARAQ
jgi:hypothetical protein